jgi:perosamine synthetase
LELLLTHIAEYIPMLNQVEPWFDEAEASALQEYLASGGWMADHTKTREFERMIAEYVGSKHCIVVNNATAALFLSLKAVGIGPGDEVIVPDYTMAATANSVVLAGATPIFHDIDTTLCLDISTIEKSITPKTKAFIYVSINGRCHSMEMVTRIAKEHNLYLIEDSAQSLGSFNSFRHLGTFGSLGVFSFSIHKIITTGNGGAMVTDDDELARRVRSMKDFGRSRNGADEYLEMGWNFKFTDLQAVVGIEQMKKLEWRVRRKKEMYSLYHSLLKDTVEFIPTNLEDTTPFFMDILAEDRDDLAQFLLEHEIGSRKFYPSLHSQKAYGLSGNFPVSESAAASGLWLPSSSFLTNQQINTVCDCIKEFYA